MNKLYAIAVAISGAVSLAIAAEPATNSTPRTTPDWAGFTNGVPFADFQKQLGVPGIREPNASRSEALYDFDLEGLWIKAVVATQESSLLVKRFVVIEDGLSPAERQKERMRRGPAWAAAVRESTNSVGSFSPAPGRPPGTNGTSAVRKGN